MGKTLDQLKKKLEDTLRSAYTTYDQNFGNQNGRFNLGAQTRAMMDATPEVAAQQRQAFNNATPRFDATAVRSKLPNFATPTYGSPTYKAMNVLSKVQPMATSVVESPVNDMIASPFGLAKVATARTPQQALADTAQFAKGPLTYAGLRVAPKPVMSGGFNSPTLLQAAKTGFKTAAPWGGASGALSGLQAGENMSLGDQLIEMGKQGMVGTVAAGAFGAGAAGASFIPGMVGRKLRIIPKAGQTPPVKPGTPTPPSGYVMTPKGWRSLASGKYSAQPKQPKVWVSQLGENGGTSPRPIKVNDTIKEDLGLSDNWIDRFKNEQGYIRLGTSKGKQQPVGVSESSIYYNTNRLNVSDKAKKFAQQTLQDSAQQVDDVTGAPLTFKEVKARAQFAPQLKKVFTREDAEKIGAKAVVLRQKVADLSRIGVANDDFIDALIQDKAFGQYTARLLGQRRMAANPDPKSLYHVVVADILRKGADPEELAIAMKGIDLNDAEQLTKLYRGFVPASFGQGLDKLRYGSMLSSPLTHLNNNYSNFQGTGIIEPIKKTVEGVIDAGVSAVTGRERTRFAGEGVSYAAGYYKNFGNATKAFYQTLTGKRANTNPDTKGIKLSTGGWKRGVENVVDAPQTALEAADQFFRALTQGGLEASGKYRQMRIGGRLPDASKQADEMLFRGDLTKEGAGVLSNFLGDMAQGVGRWRNSKYAAVRWPSKLTIPFLVTATNVVKAGVEYNPVLGAVNMIGNEDKIAQAAKMAIGATVAYIGANYAMQDRLTFGVPTSEPVRKAREQAGITPYSIKIGDNWYSYSKLHPAIAFNLATVAAVTEAIKEGRITENTADRIMNGAAASLRFIADQSFFRNVGDFVGAVSGNGTTVAKLASNYPSQVIPFRAGLSWVNNMLDTYQREPNKEEGYGVQLMEQIMAQLPGLSDQVATKKDLFGQPMERQHRFVNAVSPMRMSTENPEGRALYDASIQKSRQTKEVNDTKKLMEKELGPIPEGSIVRPSETPSKSEQPVSTDIELPPGAKIVGDKVLYTEDGSVKSTSLKELANKQRSERKGFLDAQYTLQADRLKRADDASGWLALSQTYVDYLTEYKQELDAKTDVKDQLVVQNKIEDIQAQIDKYKGYNNSFTKSKKGKKLSSGGTPKRKRIAIRKTPAMAKINFRSRKTAAPTSTGRSRAKASIKLKTLARPKVKIAGPSV